MAKSGETRGVTDFNEGSKNYRDVIARAKGEQVPLGGAPMPAMPRLDSTPPKQHGVQGDKRASAPMGQMLSREEQEELVRSGKMIPGVGAAYRANQPAAGAVEVTPPQQPAPASGGVTIRGEGAGLRPETVEGLAAVAAATRAAEAKKKETPEGADKVIEEVDDLTDEFEVNEIGQRVRSLFNNKARREAIESRCAPMKIEDLLMRGEVHQRVPIYPGKIEPTFRSVGLNEDLFVKRRMSTVRGPDQYIFDMFSIMNLVLSLYAIGDKPMPSHTDKDGEVTDELFDAKMRVVMRMPLALVADMSTNYVWFSRRVQKLIVVDDIKGF